MGKTIVCPPSTRSRARSAARSYDSPQQIAIQAEWGRGCQKAIHAATSLLSVLFTFSPSLVVGCRGATTRIVRLARADDEDRNGSRRKVCLDLGSDGLLEMIDRHPWDDHDAFTIGFGLGIPQLLAEPS
jgi:hypothetical protein